MNRRLYALGLVAFAALAGCAGNDGKISVAPSDIPLTDNGADKLFTVTLEDSGQKDGYSMDGLEVKVNPNDKGAIPVVCTLGDTNKNGRFDQGESLSCKEGETNELGRSIAGKKVKVAVYAKIDGETERVGETEWTPR